MLPKSLDGDSAGGMKISTPPVQVTAEALFNSAFEHITGYARGARPLFMVPDIQKCFSTEVFNGV